ncbi:hypothetical protein [Labrys neptuniae]|uniref:Uncharacterized protein n=1 Tax=Labrys neptuniae TaxID=376174 RepID=A0ABV3PIK7_9HYPH
MARKAEFTVEIGAEYRRTSLIVNTDELRISTTDRGNTAKRLFGREEYEQILIMKGEEYINLLFCLLLEKYSGQANLLKEFSEFCRAKGIPTERIDWHSD